MRARAATVVPTAAATFVARRGVVAARPRKVVATAGLATRATRRAAVPKRRLSVSGGGGGGATLTTHVRKLSPPPAAKTPRLERCTFFASPAVRHRRSFPSPAPVFLWDPRAAASFGIRARRVHACRGTGGSHGGSAVGAAHRVPTISSCSAPQARTHSPVPPSARPVLPPLARSVAAPASVLGSRRGVHPQRAVPCTAHCSYKTSRDTHATPAPPLPERRAPCTGVWNVPGLWPTNPPCAARPDAHQRGNAPPPRPAALGGRQPPNRVDRDARSRPFCPHRATRPEVAPRLGEQRGGAHRRRRRQRDRQDLGGGGQAL